MMNKRILELSKEAGSVADATYAKGPDAIWLREYNKKFAELIVRECADISNQAERQCQHPGTQILKHFGVEE
jgi:hypothetical protein